MLKHILPALAVVALSASSVTAQTATPATPGVSLVIREGKVTLKAEQASLRQILAEWERQGQVKVVGADKLVGAPVTLSLVDVPEKQALEIVMRGVPGYMAIDRVAQAEAAAGPSRYDRVVVMARATTPVPAAAAAGGPRGMPSPAQPPAGFQPQTMPGARVCSHIMGSIALSRAARFSMARPNAKIATIAAMATNGRTKLPCRRNVPLSTANSPIKA
jgi:hypothetical protein